MNRLIETLCMVVKNWFGTLAEDTADAIENGERLRACWNVLTAVMAVLGALGGITLLLVLLYAARGVLIPLIVPPLLIVLLIASYLSNTKDKKISDTHQEDRALLEERAEAQHEYVRDGMFFVLRALSDYTPIIHPASPSAIETNARFSIQNGVVIFQFNALVADTISDMLNFKQMMERLLGQMLRNHELPGLPSELVIINGRTYPPVQILSLVDLGSSVNINVVFSTENSIHLIEQVRKMQRGRKEAARPEIPYDDEF